VPAEHKKIEHFIDDSLKERSFWWFILRNYTLGLFSNKYKTNSMRLQRIEAERLARKKAQQQQVNESVAAV
jgi:hypothetical protein